MRNFGVLMAVAAFGAMSVAANAIVVDITEVTEGIVTVNSTNTIGGQQLTYVLSQNQDNGVDLQPTESNIGAGFQNLSFLSPPGNNGTYDFTNLPFTFTIELNAPTGGPYTCTMDLLVAAHTFNTPGTGGVTVTGEPGAQGGQGNRSGGVSIEIDSIDGDTTLGTFSTGEAARVHTFNFCGQDTVLKLRETQSPSVAATGNTALEGRIAAASTPEPGSIAMLFGTGIFGSLLAIRRRK
jgi:hypothetical protein